MEDGLKKAGIIIIGDEILKGHVRDSHSNYLCKRFHAIGVKVCRIATVPDEVADIAEEVASFSEKFDIVVTTGGIGPTHDDMTYEAIASALNDKIVLHSEMAEVIKSYFRGAEQLESNPVLKMALIPQSSKLIYILPKPDKENPDLEKQNRYLSTSQEKKPFPVVQVKNIYVLPGMREWLEHAFNQLEDIFKDPNFEKYTMFMFLRAPEVKIVKELNTAVNKYQNRVIFGSYAADGNDRIYQTKITLEGASLDDVTSAFSYLKSLIPKQHFCRELHHEIADLVYNLTGGLKSLSTALRDSLKTIETALTLYDSEEIYVSFNGGKDCTVLLHLVWAVNKKAGNTNKINTIYIRSEDSFPEVDRFIERMEQKYNLNLLTFLGPIKSALTELHGNNKNIKAIFMGTRRTDPYASEMQEFQMCDEDWPRIMRVNPILDWSYRDIWDFLRLLNVPYCSLYDQGYTSIGNPRNTVPNPALKIAPNQNKYLPAYRLIDDSLERNGRR